MSESRYEDCEILKEGGKEYLGVRLPVEIPPRPDDRFHTVVTGDRLDVLAYRYLGNADFWWVICDSNEIAFPFEIVVPVQLRIPEEGWLRMV